MMPFAWMDLEIIIPSEGSQTEKDKYHMISLTCKIYQKKKGTHEFIYKIETDSDQRTQAYGYQGGTIEGGMNLEFGINVYTL